MEQACQNFLVKTKFLKPVKNTFPHGNVWLRAGDETLNETLHLLEIPILYIILTWILITTYDMIEI